MEGGRKNDYWIDFNGAFWQKGNDTFSPHSIPSKVCWVKKYFRLLVSNLLPLELTRTPASSSGLAPCPAEPTTFQHILRPLTQALAAPPAQTGEACPGVPGRDEGESRAEREAATAERAPRRDSPGRPPHAGARRAGKADTGRGWAGG
ncbi:unnamed protein product [Natator depressus]